MLAEIKIGGFGGQGVILSGIIIGKAATIYEDKFATLMQSFGPEARGSSCSAQVIVSDNQILYPYVIKPKILVVMSQEAFRKFSPEMDPNGILVYEDELVKPEGLPNTIKTFGIPATRFAEELKKKMVLNIIMVGFFTAVTKLLNVDSVRKAVEVSVPPNTVDFNVNAFNKGYEYGIKQV